LRNLSFFSIDKFSDENVNKRNEIRHHDNQYGNVDEDEDLGAFFHEIDMLPETKGIEFR